VHNLGLMETVMTGHPSTYSSIASKLPNQSMRNLASSVQNHAGYIKILWHHDILNPPTPMSHIVTKVQPPSPPQNVMSFKEDP